MPFLLEYEAKKIFAKENIKTPMGDAASTPREAREIAEKIGKPVAIKIQIYAGRRGRAGGIKFAEDAGEAERLAESLLNQDFQGHKVTKVLVEEKLKIDRELYLGVVTDRAAKSPAVLVSSEGGMEVEEIAVKFPEKLARMNIEIWRGLQNFQAVNLSRKAGVPRDMVRNVASLLHQLYWNIYRKYDAAFTEINPLCLTEGGVLLAADARLHIDDDSMRRHRDITPEIYGQRNEREKISSERGFGYVELNTNGKIACIANGAGLGMSVMDYVNEATEEGALACFLDVGGRFYELAGEALKMVLTLPNLKAVLFHSYGGVTRADILAGSVCKAIKEIKPRIPIFIQVSGTGEKEAIEIMKRESPGFKEQGVTVEWSSHTVTGAEDSSALKGGIDILEAPVKRVVEWCGYQYRRKSPEWLPANPKWEEATRRLIKGTLPQRPEPEFKKLAEYE